MQVYPISGRLKEISDIQEVTPNFRKREFVICQEGQNEQWIRLVCVNNKISILDNVKVGQNVQVSFNIRGKKWTSNDGKTGINQTLQAFEIKPI